MHSAYARNSHLDGKVYAVLVDTEEFTDVDILDITDPADPVLVNDTLDLWDEGVNNFWGVEVHKHPGRHR